MPQEKLVNIKLSDIRPNPNRDLKFNPFNEEKIAALMASIDETGFWTNVIVRKSPDGKGYEQAYGHHRIESAKRSGIKEADFVVRDLDENMMLKMMELENQEDYRYCPLSLLESVKAVVNALAAGRIAPFDHTTVHPRLVLHTTQFYRYAPNFTPKKVLGDTNCISSDKAYTVRDIARFLGRTKKYGPQVMSKKELEQAEMRKRNGAPLLGDKNAELADPKITAALDALYLLEVKAITTANIKDMNWSQLGKFVADIKQRRERVIQREVKTKEEVAKINAENLRIQAEQKAKEKDDAEARAKLIAKLAEAKKEENRKRAAEIKAKLDAADAAREERKEIFKEQRKQLEVKVEQIKQKAEESKKEDLYLALRKETDRLVHLLERRDEEDEIKAISRKALHPNDRERLRQAALVKGTWYKETIARMLIPPTSAKEDLEESRKREETKRKLAEKETQ